AAPAHLAQNAEVPQPRQPRASARGRAAGGAAGAVAAEVLDPQEDGEQLADVVGQLGVAAAVVLESRPFAAALSVEELRGQLLDRVAVAAAGGGTHGRIDLMETRRSRATAPSPTFVHAGDRGEDLLEPSERPDVPVARSLLAQAEHQRSLV